MVHMEFEQFKESPFLVKFSLEPLLLEMERECAGNKDYADRYYNLLQEAKSFPELYHHITMPFLYENKVLIDRLLANLFPPVLTKNEIKAITIPLHNFIYHPTQRFQDIINNAGENFKLTFSGITADKFYILSCCVILQYHHRRFFKTGFPLFYNIPNKDGIINHYRILNNTDFVEIIPTEKAVELNDQDIDLLLDNYEDLELWKQYFPPNSWIMKGFGLINLYDATEEIAISNLKSKLIEQPETTHFLKEEITTIFRSIYQVPDLEIGHINYDLKKNQFSKMPIDNVMGSIILENCGDDLSGDKIHNEYFTEILNDHRYYSISDVPAFYEKNPNSEIAKYLKNKGFKSAIFAKIYKNSKNIGILELVSRKKRLNSVNANKLDIVLPYLKDTIDRIHTSIENEIAAIIQQEYTSIHPSVYWKFHDEAVKHISFNSDKNSDTNYQSIGFNELIPLYGQSDVKGSSVQRNHAILQDLKSQLDLILRVLEIVESDQDLQPLIDKIKSKKNDLSNGLMASTEIEIQNFFYSEINPVLNRLKLKNIHNNQNITIYFNQIDPKSNIFDFNRRRFDESISIINKEISALLDKRQEEQQKIFPFYYERFKTDGVEHSLYIGSSIAPWLSYDDIYLKNLRIWQLRVIAETEIKFNNFKDNLPYPLEITSLILAYSTPLSINFRMDEKRFDVDGSYNARYEMIKKRIDKAHIKNTTERIVQPGKICIVYSNEIEKQEYINYINTLQKEDLLLKEIETIEVENLPGIIGLHALRVRINVYCDTFTYPFYE